MWTRLKAEGALDWIEELTWTPDRPLIGRKEGSKDLTLNMLLPTCHLTSRTLDQRPDIAQ